MMALRIIRLSWSPERGREMALRARTMLGPADRTCIQVGGWLDIGVGQRKPTGEEGNDVIKVSKIMDDSETAVGA